MAIKIKEILANVSSYTRGNHGDVNATTEFKKLFNEHAEKLSNVLNDGNETSTELLETLNQIVYAILDYGHYTSDPDDNERLHLHLKK